MSSTICSVEVCPRVVGTKGYCQAHYDWSRVNGWEVPVHAIGRFPPKIKLPCSVAACGLIAYGRGYCQQHATWSRMNGGAVPAHVIAPKLRPGEKRACSVAACGLIAHGRGYCRQHGRWSRMNGGAVPAYAIRRSPALARPQGKVWSLEEISAHASPYDRGRIWVYAKLLPRGFFYGEEWEVEASLEDRGPCRLWPVTDRNGYAAIIQTSRGRHSAYRAVAELVHGLLEEGYEVDHLCERRSCVEPRHLELVPSSENRRRAALSRERRGVLSQHPEAVRRREDRERQALLPG